MTSRQTTDHQLKPPFSTACLSRDPHRKRKSFQSRFKIKFLQGCMKSPPHCAIILWLSSALSLICKPPQILWSCGLTLTGVGSHSIVSIVADDERGRPTTITPCYCVGDWRWRCGGCGGAAATMVEILSLQLQPIGSSVFRAETPSFGQKSGENSAADTAAGKSIS